MITLIFLLKHESLQISLSPHVTGALHWAAHKEYEEMALFLIANGGDIMLKDEKGRTPLSMASKLLGAKMIG